MESFSYGAGRRRGGRYLMLIVCFVLVIFQLTFAGFINQLGYQGSPAGLMAGTEPAAGISVEIFVEQDEIAPVRIVLELLQVAEDRTASALITLEEPVQTSGQLIVHL